MKKENCLLLGYFVKTHGFKGSMGIILDTGFPFSLEGIDTILIEEQGNLIPYFVDGISVNGLKGYMQLEGVSSLEQARNFLKKPFYIPKSKNHENDLDSSDLRALVGFTLFDEKRGKIGLITEVSENTMQAVAKIRYNTKDIFFPLADELILNIDPDQKTIRVQFPEGLFELYTED
jgi:16S rRNA processing protein RimM